MNRKAIASLPLSLAIMAFVGPLPAPLEPANDGKLLCISPDPARKTCASLIRYARGEDGHLDVFEQSVLTESPLLIWEGSYPMQVKDGQVCERALPEHAEQFRLSPSPGYSDKIAKMLPQLMAATQHGKAGHELCVEFAAERDSLVIKYWMNGQRTVLPDDPAIWVSAGDGYRVWR